MTAAVQANRKWLSASIFIKHEPDIFIYRYLAPFLIEAKRRRRLRRFFFIRYSEGGPHIRIRIRPVVPRGELAAELCDVLATFQNEVVPGSDDRIDETVYDRTEAYFGETTASVYSELLNEYTSLLSFRLFSGSACSRTYITVCVASTLLFLLNNSSANSKAVCVALLRSRQLALEIMRDAAWRPLEMNAGRSQQFREIMRRIMPGVNAALFRDPTAMQIVRLLRRASRLGGPGEFVATHSLHLFCNKNGLLPPEEYHVFEALHDES